MKNSETNFNSKLATRILNHSYLGVLWFGLVLAVLVFVGWPIRNAALVCWVYGTDAYFNQGIRVVPGKPTRFSNGDIAPSFPDFITGFAAFFVTVAFMIAAFELFLRIYSRLIKKQRDHL